MIANIQNTVPPRRPQRVLNDTKLIIISQGGPLRPIEDQFRTFRGPLFHKPVTGLNFYFLEGHDILKWL